MNKYKIFIGVDLGKLGAFVALDAHGTVLDFFTTPETWQGWNEKLKPYLLQDCIGIVESVTGSGPNGAGNNFTFGKIVERAIQSLERVGIEVKAVSPTTWMKNHFMMVKTPGESDSKWKNRLKDLAISLFPDHKKSITLKTADAFLIAKYCQEINTRGNG